MKDKNKMVSKKRHPLRPAAFLLAAQSALFLSILFCHTRPHYLCCVLKNAPGKNYNILSSVLYLHFLRAKVNNKRTGFGGMKRSG